MWVRSSFISVSICISLGFLSLKPDPDECDNGGYAQGYSHVVPLLEVIIDDDLVAPPPLEYGKPVHWFSWFCFSTGFINDSSYNVSLLVVPSGCFSLMASKIASATL